MLNSLINSRELRNSVEILWKRDKTAFAVMDILIAVRSEGKKKVLNKQGQCIVLDRFFDSVDGVMEYLESTGLREIFEKGIIKNLVDYVFGIETGLDSNARKNRSGHVMENKVANIFQKNNINYRREVYSREWKEITNALGDDETRDKTYLIEVNFYSGGGSKLNEVARSYSDIAPKINAIPGFEFVWITDGIGWKAARNKLQEAYSIIPCIYNLTSVEEFIKQLI